MSAQRLSPKKVRAIERTIGEPVLRAWSHGGYWFDFVTPDHRHGDWNKITQEVKWASPTATLVHYNTCRETWPE